MTTVTGTLTVDSNATTSPSAPLTTGAVNVTQTSGATSAVTRITAASGATGMQVTFRWVNPAAEADGSGNAIVAPFVFFRWADAAGVTIGGAGEYATTQPVGSPQLTVVATSIAPAPDMWTIGYPVGDGSLPAGTYTVTVSMDFGYPLIDAAYFEMLAITKNLDGSPIGPGYIRITDWTFDTAALNETFTEDGTFTPTGTGGSGGGGGGGALAAGGALVEIAWGVAPGVRPTESDWVDVTADVLAENESPAVVARSGRAASQLDTIQPGELNLTLISAAGKFNPRNTASPYAGDLRSGVPIRVRNVSTVAPSGSLFGRSLFGLALFGTSGITTSTTRWTGLVATDFEQELTATGDPLVEIRGHDLLGALALAPMPLTAFHAEMKAHPPDAWWQSTPEGWSDDVSGLRARQYGGRVEVDPLVDGDEKAWAPTMTGTAGIVESGIVDTDGVAGSFCWSGWVRAATPPTSSVIARQVDADGATMWGVSSAAGRLAVTWATTAGSRTWTGPADLVREQANHVAFHIDPAGPTARLWLNGSEVTLGAPTTNAGTGTADRIELGPRAVDPSGVVLAIDHVTWWVDAITDPAPWVRTLADAGRLAWVGDTLDERVRHIVTAAGWGDWIGDLDTSGIVTGIGYRGQGSALDMLAKIEQAEQGRIWCDPDGFLRFASRSWSWADATARTTQATFSDIPAVLDDGAFEMIDDGTSVTSGPRGIVTTATVTSTNGRPQTATAPPLTFAQWGPREAVTLTDLPHSSDRASRSIADWIIYSRSTGNPYIDGVAFDPAVSAEQAAFAHQVVEGWAVEVRIDADLDCDGTLVGDPINVNGHVVGATWVWSAHTERAVLQIDSSRHITNPFTWGTSLWGGSDVWTF